MRRLKTKQELEQERIDAQRYALGNVILNTQKLLLIYARQSSSKQYVSNIYSAMEQRDGLLEKASTLGWTRDEQWILYVENNLAKKTQVSGSLRIDQRPGLQALTDVIESGKASAVLVVSVDRITRDEDLITPTQFANLCKRNGVLIITDDYIYDFNNPNRDDMGQFMREATASKEFIPKQIRGKALKGRTRKANMGLVANGRSPVGLMLDESRDNLVPSPHAERVDWLYARFRALDASLAGLYREVVSMALQGIPLFPYDESIDPKSMQMDTLVKGDVTSGWTIKSRHGLQHILSNPMYAGHLVFNGSIVKMNAHQAIVDADNWQYAFDHLADVDLDGNVIERKKRSVRYTKRGNTNDALLTGTRDNGTVVIDGVNGAHVHYNAATKAYTLWQRSLPTVSGFETSITTNELDTILESRLLHWLNAAERQEKYNDEHQYTSPGHSPVRAMAEIKDVQPKGQTGVQEDLTLTNQELATVQRALQFQDSMSDERLEETLKKEKRLIKRRAELEQVQAHGERLARQREQAKDDIETAASKWVGWTLEKQRSFIRMVTESITLEELASGWLRLVIVWSPIMGFIYPLTSSTRATDTAYIWRDSGTVWTDEEMDTLRAFYPTSSRGELSRMLPSRSWNAIRGKAITSGISRKYGKHESADLAEDTSLTDEQVLSEFMLKRERIQWKHDYLYNDGSQS